ncbi:MAG: hypothetical protein K8S27_03710 [Candidatus Omnitrophica bacterium]|nr:hypothetical protein [Candidatus Omnitrophota bacterium]
MKRNCKLCNQKGNLENSHIIPSFIYKWLKESSGTGYLRFGQTPNKRVQDGLKEYWLCPTCEDLFQKWETEFAKHIFHPIVKNNKNQFNYGPWLLKFSVSLSWRVLLFIKEKTNLSNFPQKLKNEANLALKTWKKFLLDKEPNPKKYQQHMLPLNAIRSHSFDNLPSNMNRYLLRSVNIDVANNTKEAFVYIKLPRILLTGFIHIEKPRQWKNTIVHVKKGTLGADRYVLPKYMADYLKKQADKSKSLNKKISEKQRSKINETYKKNIDKFATSDTFAALQHDVELFGESKVFDLTKSS